MRRWVILLLVLPVGCVGPTPQPAPHYVLGQPYPAGGVWYYPRERYDAVETGLATVYPSQQTGLTTDGEAFDQALLTAGHATLQLPAIAQVTNLENGLQITVRINDRGPVTPHRLLEVTQRAAQLLGFPASGVARIRLRVLPAESHDAVDAMSNAPRLAVAAAPRGAVQATDLQPPGGTAALPARSAPAAMSSPEPAAASVAAVARLPETRTQVAPAPGRLYIRLGTFQTAQYATIQRARVAALGARVVAIYDGRVRTYRVIIGPLGTVAEADAMLDQVLRAGVTDAQIVVE